MAVLEYLAANSLIAHPFKTRKAGGSNPHPIDDSWFYDIIFVSHSPTLRSVYVSSIEKSSATLTLTFKNTETDAVVAVVPIGGAFFTNHHNNEAVSFASASGDTYAVKIILGPGLPSAIDFTGTYTKQETELSNTAFILSTPRVDAINFDTYAKDDNGDYVVTGVASITPTIANPSKLKLMHNITFANEAPNYIGISVIAGSGAGLYDDCAEQKAVYTVNSTTPNSAGSLFLNPSTCYTIEPLTLALKNSLDSEHLLDGYTLFTVHTSTTEEQLDIINGDGLLGYVGVDHSLVLKNFCTPKCSPEMKSAYANYFNRVTDGAADLDKIITTNIETRGQGYSTAPQYFSVADGDFGREDSNNPLASCLSLTKAGTSFVTNYHEGRTLQLRISATDTRKYTITKVVDKNTVALSAAIVAYCTATLSSNVLTVTQISSGTLAVGNFLQVSKFDSRDTPPVSPLVTGVTITAFRTGAGAGTGGIGTYTVDGFESTPTGWHAVPRELTVQAYPLPSIANTSGSRKFFKVTDNGVITSLNCATLAYNSNYVVRTKPYFELKYVTNESYSNTGTSITLLSMVVILYNPSTASVSLKVALSPSDRLALQGDVKIRNSGIITTVTDLNYITTTLTCHGHAFVEAIYSIGCGVTGGSIAVDVSDVTAAATPVKVDSTQTISPITGAPCTEQNPVQTDKYLVKQLVGVQGTLFDAQIALKETTTTTTFKGTIAGKVLTLTSAAVGNMTPGYSLTAPTAAAGAKILSLKTGISGKTGSTYNLDVIKTVGSPVDMTATKVTTAVADNKLLGTAPNWLTYTPNYVVTGPPTSTKVRLTADAAKLLDTATFTGAITGTTLTLTSAVTGTISPRSVLTATAGYVSPGTLILASITTPAAQNGSVYRLSEVQSSNSAVAFSGTIATTTLTLTSAAAGLELNSVLTGNKILAGTIIESKISGTQGVAGSTYKLSKSQNAPTITFSGTISGTELTLTTDAAGGGTSFVLGAGYTLTVPASINGVKILSLKSGYPGTAGSIYMLDTVKAVGTATAMTATMPMSSTKSVTLNAAAPTLSTPYTLSYKVTDPSGSVAYNRIFIDFVARPVIISPLVYPTDNPLLTKLTDSHTTESPLFSIVAINMVSLSDRTKQADFTYNVTVGSTNTNLTTTLGLSVDTATGIVTGALLSTITKGSVYTLNISATNPAGTAIASVVLKVAVDAAPVLTLSAPIPPNSTYIIDNSKKQTDAVPLTVTNPPITEWTITKGTLPAGLRLSNTVEALAITGILSEPSAGSNTLSVTASNIYGTSAPVTFTISYPTIVTAPIFTSPLADATYYLGIYDAASTKAAPLFKATATGATSYSAAGLPSGFQLDPLTGEFYGKLDSSEYPSNYKTTPITKTYTIPLLASNAVGRTLQKVNISFGTIDTPIIKNLPSALTIDRTKTYTTASPLLQLKTTPQATSIEDKASVATFKGTISTNILTLVSPITGTLSIGATLSGTGIQSGTVILDIRTSTLGAVNSTYTLSKTYITPLSPSFNITATPTTSTLPSGLILNNTAGSTFGAITGKVPDTLAAGNYDVYFVGYNTKSTTAYGSAGAGPLAKCVMTVPFGILKVTSATNLAVDVRTFNLEVEKAIDAITLTTYGVAGETLPVNTITANLAWTGLTLNNAAAPSSAGTGIQQTITGTPSQAGTIQIALTATSAKMGSVTTYLTFNIVKKYLTISGTVKAGSPAVGLAGVTVSISNATTTTDSSGKYTFTGIVPGTVAQSYTVSVSKTGVYFNLSSRNVTLNNANATGVDFSGLTGYRLVTGTIKKDGVTPLEGVTVTGAGTPATITTTNAAGTYSLQIPQISSQTPTVTYTTVKPTLTDYIFAPVSANVNNGISDTTADFVATFIGTLPAVTNLTSTSGDKTLKLDFQVLTSKVALTAKYQYRLNNGSWVDFTPTPSAVIGLNTPYTYNIPNLVNGTKYSVDVRAVSNSNLTPGLSSNLVATLTGPAPAPTVVAQSGDSKITLTVIDPGTSTGIVRHEYSTDNKTNFLTLPAPTNVVTRATTSGNPQIANGSTYTLYVRTITSIAGKEYIGSWSTAVTGVPTATALPPTGLTLTAGEKALTVSFTAPAGTITRYEYDLNNRNQWSTLASTKIISTETTGGDVSLQAGRAMLAGFADGLAATLKSPSGIARDTAGNLYVADTGNHTIRKIAVNGTVTTLAGTAGSSGVADGGATIARFSSPSGIAIDTAGNLYVADTGNHTIRKIVVASGTVSTFAGTAGSSGLTNANGIAARFNSPQGITIDAAGNLYVADTGNHQIRKIVISTTAVSLLSGATTIIPGSTENITTNTSVRYSSPKGIVYSTAGFLYVADTANHTIRKIYATTGRSAAATVFSGLVGTSGRTDGTLAAARYSSPTGIAADSLNNLYVTDSGNHLIRKITAAEVTTVCGLGGVTGSNNGTGSTALFYTPYALTGTTAGKLYVADRDNHTIRTVSEAGNALVNGTTYSVSLRAVNSIGAGATSTLAKGTPGVVPIALTELACTPSDKSIIVAFKTPTTPAETGGHPITGYKYQISTTKDSFTGLPELLLPINNIITLTTAALTSTLVNNTTYYVRIAAVNDLGTGTYVGDSKPYVPNPKPAAPTYTLTPGDKKFSLSAISQQPNTPTVARYEYSINNSGVWSTLPLAVAPSTDRIITLTYDQASATPAQPAVGQALVNGTKYNVSLRGVTSGGVTGLATTKTGVSPGTAASVPTITVVVPTVQFSGTIAAKVLTLTTVVTTTTGGSLGALGVGYLITAPTAAANTVITSKASGTVNQSGSTYNLSAAKTVATATAMTAMRKNIMVVTVTTPIATGGFPILNYQYSTDNGTTWRNRDDLGVNVASTNTTITIANTSAATTTPLASGTTYQLKVRAVTAFTAAGTASAATTVTVK